MPLRSAKAAQWMRTHVPGVHIPDEVIRRLAGAQDQAKEGRRLCVDLIREIRAIATCAVREAKDGDEFCRRAKAEAEGIGYQTLINAALREYLDGKAPRFEDTLRRIIREELKSSAA